MIDIEAYEEGRMARARNELMIGIDDETRQFMSRGVRVGKSHVWSIYCSFRKGWVEKHYELAAEMS